MRLLESCMRHFRAQHQTKAPRHPCVSSTPKVVHLQFNNISGTVPGCLSKLQHLRVLNLAGNRLEGAPRRSCTLSVDRSLRVKDNPKNPRGGLKTRGLRER